jgi:hypothetical protein
MDKRSWRSDPLLGLSITIGGGGKSLMSLWRRRARTHKERCLKILFAKDTVRSTSTKIVIAEEREFETAALCCVCDVSISIVVYSIS